MLRGRMTDRFGGTKSDVMEANRRRKKAMRV